MNKLHSKKEIFVAQKLGSELTLSRYIKHANFILLHFIGINYVQNCKMSSNAGLSDSAKVAWTLTLLPLAVITYERVTGSVDNPISCFLQC